jgi:hypothetical protein
MFFYIVVVLAFIVSVQIMRISITEPENVVVPLTVRRCAV